MTDHMESGSFHNTPPVSFKLASQKRPRRSGQIKVVVKGGVAFSTSVLCDISAEDELKAPLVVKKKNSCLPENVCTKPFQATSVKTVLFKVIILGFSEVPEFPISLMLSCLLTVKENSTICSFHCCLEREHKNTWFRKYIPFVVSQRALPSQVISSLSSFSKVCNKYFLHLLFMQN